MGRLLANPRYQEYSFPRLFVPWNIRSHDGTFVLGTIRSLEHSLPGPFVPWNFRSQDSTQDYSFPGTFVPWTVRSMELSFPGTFVSEARLRRHQRKTAREVGGSVVGLRGRTADNVGTAPQVLAYICSGVARHFLAVPTRIRCLAP